jgi:hypothetical protein
VSLSLFITNSIRRAMTTSSPPLPSPLHSIPIPILYIIYTWLIICQTVWKLTP